MSRIIIEMQTNSEGQTAVVAPIPVYTNETEGEAVFLEKCAAACRSAVAIHTVVLLDEEGDKIAKKVFKH